MSPVPSAANSILLSKEKINIIYNDLHGCRDIVVGTAICYELDGRVRVRIPVR
jgi:hypothetical protein